MDNILDLLEYYEAKCAVRDDLLDIIDQAFDLIPVGQIRQGYRWMPSDEALAVIKLAKDRLREHKELGR